MDNAMANKSKKSAQAQTKSSSKNIAPMKKVGQAKKSVENNFVFEIIVFTIKSRFIKKKGLFLFILYYKH